MWATAIGLFAGNYGFYFLGSWLPTYLVKTKGLTIAQMATTAGSIYIAWALTSLVTGWVFDRLLKAGVGITFASKFLLGIACVGNIACMAGIMFGRPTWAIGLLYAAEIFTGLGSPVVWTVSQTIAGPRAIGQWMGVQVTMGNLAGLVAPMLTGVTVDITGSFTSAFGAAAFCYVVSGISWVFGIKKVQPIEWGERLLRNVDASESPNV
jgi:nitrate/nitrite transporter NarK